MPEPKAKRSGMDFAEWKAAWGVRLNDQQEAAVQAAEGPVLLLAVPGSGKTTALIHRLGYLIFCRGVAPEHILTVTYTVSATKDMAARFAQVFGADLAGRLEFRTINGLSARITMKRPRAERPLHSSPASGSSPVWWATSARRPRGSFPQRVR